jgi:branched-chain amino acid transport system ATP-binding protein
MLELHDLQVYYGGIHALQGISLEVPDGKIVSLIGANGAGKSTTLNSIVGLVKTQSGSIKWNGQELTALNTKQIVSQGVVLVPEGRRIFPNLSVWENLTLGAYHRNDKADIEKDREMIYELFPRLKEREKQSAGTLSGGEQQMLAVGRGLMSRPKLFMLDEPSLGLAPLIVKNIFSIVKRINEQGTTVLLIEQNARAALKIADYGYVMETGRITLSGTGKDLLSDERIRHAYLGDESQKK